MPSQIPDRRAAVIAGHSGDEPTVRKALQSADPGVRAAALGALARLHALDAETLAGGLRDGSAAVIRRAAMLAGQRNDGASMLDAELIDAELLALLRDGADVVAEVAAWALGERHENADPVSAGQVVAALSSAATVHADALVREAAVAALGSVGAPGGLAAVLTATSDKATVRRRAVIALAAFEGPEVDAALSRARADRDWQVRQAAEDLS